MRGILRWLVNPATTFLMYISSSSFLLDSEQSSPLHQQSILLLEKANHLMRLTLEGPTDIESMDSSPFARLPAELRTEIWTYALRASHPLEIEENSLHPDSSDKRLLALTETCKAIRAETRLLFFLVNTFAFENILNNTDVSFDNFTSSIGADAVHSLRSLTFDIYNPGRKNTTKALRPCRPEILEALGRLRRFALEHPRCECRVHYRPVPILRTAVIDLRHVSTSCTALIAELRESVSVADTPAQVRGIALAARVVEQWRDALDLA